MDGTEIGDRSGLANAAAHGSTGHPRKSWQRRRARARTAAEIRAVVQELLDREVNRSIAAHGGRISIVDVRNGELFIAMGGGCQGCAASQVTLRQGFEVMPGK